MTCCADAIWPSVDSPMVSSNENPRIDIVCTRIHASSYPNAQL